MKKKYIVAILLGLMTCMLTGCSTDSIPSFHAMLFGEEEYVSLGYDPSDYVTLGKYKNIEVEKSVSDSDVQSALDSMIAAGDEKEVKSSDTVGEKKDAKVTFPKDYRETSLAGKEAVFTLKVNYIYKEATDALVAKLDSTYNTKTVKAFKEAAKKELESQNEQQMLSTAMSKITSEAKISKVPDELIKKIKAIQSKSLESQATQSGTDVSTLLSMYGMTEDSYYESIAKERLLAEAVAQAEGYRVTKQDFEDKIAEICKSNNITEADYRKNFKLATSDNASLEDYIVYMMKYEYFSDLVQKTLVKK